MWARCSVLPHSPLCVRHLRLAWLASTSSVLPVWCVDLCLVLSLYAVLYAVSILTPTTRARLLWLSVGVCGSTGADCQLIFCARSRCGVVSRGAVTVLFGGIRVVPAAAALHPERA